MAKLALIFGGSRGIGRAVAETFLRNGFKTVILSRDESRINETVKLLEQSSKENSGVEVTGLRCDVADENDVQEAFKMIDQRFATSPDVVVNSAGINVDKLLAKCSQEEMEDVLRTNLVGSMITSRYAVRHMMAKKKGGTITNIGSIVGRKGHAGQTVYSASKAGLVGFTKSLAREVASRDIRVNLVEPGFIVTDMTANVTGREMPIPLGRFGQPEEVAEAVYFLSTSPYITGEVLVVDGGLQLSL